MSIFDTTIGQRPVPGNQGKVVRSEQRTHQSHALVVPEVGARPTGECPTIVVLDGLLNAQPATELPLPGATVSAPEEMLAAIDTALRQNIARVAVHGLFDIE